MAEADEEHYINTWECWICQQTIFNDKVRDHCHITGKFRGNSHRKMQPIIKNTQNITCYFS